jgi:hypothetical protein
LSFLSSCSLFFNPYCCRRLFFFSSFKWFEFFRQWNNGETRGKARWGGERRKMEEEEEHKKQLLVKVERSMEKVQHSAFFKKFMEQLQDLELLEILLGTCEQGRTVDETGSCLNGATSSSSTGASPAAPEILDGKFLLAIWFRCLTVVVMVAPC